MIKTRSPERRSFLYHNSLYFALRKHHSEFPDILVHLPLNVNPQYSESLGPNAKWRRLPKQSKFFLSYDICLPSFSLSIDCYYKLCRSLGYRTRVRPLYITMISFALPTWIIKKCFSRTRPLKPIFLSSTDYQGIDDGTPSSFTRTPALCFFHHSFFLPSLHCLQVWIPFPGIFLLL